MNIWDRFHAHVSERIDPFFDGIEWTNKSIITRVPTNLALVLAYPAWLALATVVNARRSK